MAVPTAAEITTYFTSARAGNFMNPIAMTVANTIQLTRLCPIPHAWAAYCLESKTPYEAYQIGCQLIATLDTPDERDRALSQANWLQAGCQKRDLQQETDVLASLCWKK